MSETVTVTQLNSRVKSILTGSPAVRDIWVNGEVSNLRKYPSGHYYFTMKDSGSEIKAVLFSRSYQRMDFELKENMKVSAFGSVDIYVERGMYQFVVENMRTAGVGDLYLAYEALKAKLETEGLFEQSRKRPLPRYPRVIGVVTSEKGAVIHDIITTSGSRFPADIVLAPAMVQGEGAAASIVAGIRLLNRIGADVIIVGRGGGSLEDLWAFNEESVARAIAASDAPVVSAVGHETDFTIADFVADVRASTPTGAAAIILRDRTEILSQLNGNMVRTIRALRGVMDRMDSRFRVLDARLSPEKALNDLDMRSMRLDGLDGRARRCLKNKVADMRMRFEVCSAKLSSAAGVARVDSLRERATGLFARVETAMERRYEAFSARLESLSTRLESLNPRNVLSRGYGMLTDGSGRAVTSISDVEIGRIMRIHLRNGSADAEIKEKRSNERDNRC